LPALTFEALGGSSGLCIPNVSNTNYPIVKLLTSIDKNSIIGQGYLQNVVFNGISQSTVGISLGSILFKTG